MSPGEPSEIRLALTLAPTMYLIKRARRPSASTRVPLNALLAALRAALRRLLECFR